MGNNIYVSSVNNCQFIVPFIVNDIVTRSTLFLMIPFLMWLSVNIFWLIVPDGYFSGSRIILKIYDKPPTLNDLFIPVLQSDTFFRGVMYIYNKLCEYKLDVYPCIVAYG